MSTHRHIDAICVAVLVLTLAITLLFMNGEAFGLQAIVDEDAENSAGSAYFTANDQNGNWKTSGATQITLRGDHATVSGGGAYAYGGDVMITNAGKYVVSGTLDDGSIIADTNNKSKVWILLNGAEIRCSDSACLDIEQADKVFLTLAEGAENRLTTAAFSPEAEDAGMDGTVFARDDLSINGTGSLTVSAPSAHGIVGNDELVITGGEITVDAALDALHANDGLRIMAAGLKLTAGDDGIALTGAESELYIESGEIAVTASDNALSAGNSIRVAGGTLSLEAGDDAISAAGDILIEGGAFNISTGDDGIHSDSAVSVSGGTILIPSCYEGIEAITIDVSGGDITVYPEDDGLNANGGSSGFGGFGGFGGGMHGGFGGGLRPFDENSEEREPGSMPQGEPPELPDGMEPPEGLELPEGAERPEPPEGAEQGTGPDMPAQQPAGLASDAGDTSDETETWIHISGGSITVVNETARDADGLDSNGDIIISGGVIRVSMTNSGSNNALDYGSESGGVMRISGGDVIACGSYAMAEGFDADSTQCAILYNIRRGAAAGSTVTLEDSEGNVLRSYEVPCSFSSVAISCPEMQIGGTYSIVIGDSAEEITLEEVSASFGDAQSEGFGGPMNWGGMKFRP